MDLRVEGRYHGRSGSNVPNSLERPGAAQPTVQVAGERAAHAEADVDETLSVFEEILAGVPQDLRGRRAAPSEVLL